jgi:acyl-[acyl-carrier-protein] desaturase
VTDATLLHELSPVAERLFHRHLDMAKEWFPHTYVPWGRGRDFVEGEEWSSEDYPMDPAVRSALFVNLLTEDNLPYYFATIDRVFAPGTPGKGPHDVWRSWNRRWTAEENRHAIVMRDYLTVTRALDPVDLERARMHQMSTAVVPEPEHVADGLVYVALQELATRISHRNTGKLLDDRVGYDVMARVATDENLHYLFYRDLVTAALAVDPSEVVMAVERQVQDFEMPGVGIPNFAAHALAIARAGIYDFEIHHEQILTAVVLRHWKIESLDGLSPEAEASRDRLLRRIERIGRAARRFSSRRAETGGPDPRLSDDPASRPEPARALA